MAKVGTAHVEIKPVLNEDALADIAARIEATVRTAVQAGLRPAGGTPPEHDLSDTTECWCNPEVVKVCGCTWCKRGLAHPTPRDEHPEA